VRASLGVLAGACVLLAGSYAYFDEESQELGDDARRGATGRFVQLSKGVVHYELEGPISARTVVLVHGYSVPSFIWDPTYEALTAAGHRVLRYDLYGRGLSDRPRARYDADLYDAQLVELLDALGIRDPIDVAGVSMGGAVAVAFAVRHPDRVKTVALFDPSYSTGRTIPWFIRAPVIGEWVMEVLIAPHLAEGQLDDFHDRDGHEDYVARYRIQMRFEGFRRALLSTLRDYAPRDNSGEYRSLGASGSPVLLVWGRGDRSVPFARSDDVRRAIPQAEFHPIDAAGHIPHYERASVVSPILVDFLRAH
jgi:pimeloyl-ACP methyl ester carboxylesterase